MKISSISSINTNQQPKNIKKIDYYASQTAINNKQHSPSFKGEQGQAIGAALGMFAGVVASVVAGPITAIAVSVGGLLAGGFAGDKIEDSIDEKDK